jgi:3-dehydroquinate dehydratase
MCASHSGTTGLLSAAARGTITGLGPLGYELALDAAARL